MFKLMSFRSDAAFWPFTERSDFSSAAKPGLLGAMLSAPRRVVAGIVGELARRRAMRALAGLDDRMLRDIGIERGQIRHVARHGRGAASASDTRTDLSRWW